MALTLALMVLLIGLAGHLALGSDRAARLLLHAAAALSGERIGVAQVHGNLRQGLRLERVDVRFADVHAQAAALHWAPGEADFWRRRLALGRITLDDLRVTLAAGSAASDESTGLPALAVPLRIELQALEVRGLTLVPADGEPLRVAQLQLAGSLHGSRLHLARLTAHAAWGWLDAALRVDLAGAGALDGIVQGLLERPHGPPLQLTGTLGGNLLHGVQAAVHGSGAATMHLAASLDTPLAGGPWQTHVWLRRFSLQRLAADLPAWPLTVDGRARGRGADMALRLDYRLAGTPAGPVQGRLAAQGAAASWQIDAEARAAPARLTLDGGIDLAARTTRLRLEWQALRWPLSGEAATVESPTGRAELAGGLHDWALTLEAALAARGQAGQLVGKARGDTAQARLETFTARLLDGRVDGSGVLRWAPQLAYRLTATATDFDPGLLSAQWPGRVDARVAVAGQAGAGQFGIERLGGTLRGLPLGGSGTAAWQGGSLRVADVDVHLGRARARASGTVLGEGPPLLATLRVPAAGELLPGAQGAIEAQARLAGRGWAQASIELDATGLAYGDQAAQRLRARLDLDRPQDRFSCALTADGVRLGERRLSLQLTADGATSGHAAQLLVTQDAARLRLDGRGALLPDGWRGRIRAGTLDGLPPAAWRLHGAPELVLRRAGQSIARHCWHAGQARLCADGRRAAGVLDVAAQMNELPLAPLVALAVPDLAVDGRLDGRLRLRAGDGPLAAQLALDLSPGALRVPTPDGGEGRFAHGGARAEGHLAADGGRLAVRVAAPSPGESDLLSATLRLAELPAGGAAPLDGSVTARLPDIGLLAPWLEPLSALSGRIEASAQLTGTLETPAFTGEATLREAGAAVPALGIELREVQASVVGDGSDTLRLAASARSGEGTLRLDGSARRAPAGFEARLRLGGDRVQVVDTAQLQAAVSPDIVIDLADGGVSLAGELTVPRARIRAQDRPAAVQPSPDVVVQGRQTVLEPAVPLRADLRVRLGEDVRIDAYGFTGQLGGTVRLLQRPDGSMAANGQVNVSEGQYSFYGQRLPVTEGELRYAGGSPDNPALRITAMRKVGDVSAGVRLRGTAKAPVTQLFSSPAMPQADILAYLLVGRPLRQVKGGEADLLMQAGTALGARGGGALVRRLGQALGLDEAALGDGGESGTSLALGRYLSPRLYVGYGLALAEQTGAVTLRYTLTERWLLEVVSGLTQTADLLYRIER